MDVHTGGLGILDGLADEWREVLQELSGDDPYARPEWILARLRAYSPNATVVTLTLRRKGKLRIIVPLVLENGTFGGLPARKLRMPLAVPGGRNELLFAPEIGEQVAISTVREALKGFPGWDVLEFPSVYENTTVERLCQVAKNAGYRTGSWGLVPTSYLRFGCDEVEKLPANARLHRQLRQVERKIRTTGDLRLNLHDKADPIPLQRFFDLEASGWKGKEKSAILCDRRSYEFFNQIAKELEKFNYLSLYLLELDSRLISAHFGFYYHGRYYAPKAGYDEGYGEYHPGHLIVKEILRDCIKRGVHEYPMGIQEEWKLRWTKEVQKRTFHCIFNDGVWARTLFATRFQIKPRLKRLLRTVKA